MFGISLLSIVVALGFEYVGHKIAPRRKGAPAGAGNGPGGAGGAEKPSAAVFFQHWLTCTVYFLSGICWAVGLWPVVQKLGWQWLVVSAVFGFAGLVLGFTFDVIRDKKPDLVAFIAVRFMPLLLLITVVNWAVFTSTTGKQFEQYQQNMNDKSSVKVAK